MQHARVCLSLPRLTAQAASLTLSCVQKFFTMTELRLHKVSHGDQKPFLCPIEGCTKGFSDRSGLRFVIVQVCHAAPLDPPHHPHAAYRYHKKAAHSDVSTFAFKCLYPDCGE